MFDDRPRLVPALVPARAGRTSSLSRQTRVPGWPWVQARAASRWPRRWRLPTPACARSIAPDRAAGSRARIRSTGRASSVRPWVRRRAAHVRACESGFDPAFGRSVPVQATKPDSRAVAASGRSILDTCWRAISPKRLIVDISNAERARGEAGRPWQTGPCRPGGNIEHKSGCLGPAGILSPAIGRCWPQERQSGTPPAGGAVTVGLATVHLRCCTVALADLSGRND